MKPQMLLAEQIERIADSMAYCIETTSPEVLTWRPEIPGSAETRSILEMVGECVAVNRRLTAKFVKGDVESIAEPVLASGEEAARQILESAHGLSGMIRDLTDEGLEAEYPHVGSTGSAVLPSVYLIVGAYRNMAYHSGQINLIQMLKGDGEFHRPPSWYGPARPFR